MSSTNTFLLLSFHIKEYCTLNIVILLYSDGVHVDDPLAPPHTPPGTTGLAQTTNLYHSKSNPDLTSLYCYDDLRAPDYPEHVLKVYKADQTCKYLLIHKETTAHEVNIYLI